MSMNEEAERADAERVERVIRDAFANAQYPGDENLVSDPGYWESADAHALLKGKHWSEITLSNLISQNGCVWLLTPEAFRFYIPAFLITSLGLTGNPDMVYESTLYVLSPPPRGIGTQEKFTKRVQGFTTEQKNAIKVAMEHFRDCYDEEDAADSLPAYALENYWNAASSSS